MDLRETIEALRTRNEEAQAVIHGALNNPDNMKGLETDKLIFQLSFYLFAHLPACSHICLFWYWLFLFSRPANPTSELMWEHFQSQQPDQYVEHGQLEGPRCQEEEEKELGKNTPCIWGSVLLSPPGVCRCSVCSPQWWWHSSMNPITASVTGLSLLCVVLFSCFRSLRWVQSLSPYKASIIFCHKAWWTT